MGTDKYFIMGTDKYFIMGTRQIFHNVSIKYTYSKKSTRNIHENICEIQQLSGVDNDEYFMYNKK